MNVDEIDWFRLHVFSIFFSLDLWLTSTSHLLHSSQVGSTRLLWCLPWSWPIVSQFHSVSTLHKGVQGNSKLGNSSTKKATPLHKHFILIWFKSFQTYWIIWNLYLNLTLILQLLFSFVSKLSKFQGFQGFPGTNLSGDPKKKQQKVSDSYIARHL